MGGLSKPLISSTSRPPAQAWGKRPGFFPLPQKPSIRVASGTQQPEALRVGAPDSEDVSARSAAREGEV